MSEPEDQPDPKRIASWTLALAVPVFAAAVVAGFFQVLPTALLIRIAEQQFAVVVGLPSAALLAAFIVVALRYTEGPLRFEGLGFKFEGGSGQGVLWVVCFLAIAGAIKLLWQGS